MQSRPLFELYKEFIDFVARDIQKERSQVNRKMFSVFLWCFLLPTVSCLTVLILVKLRVLPRNARNHLDWIVLILPVFYSLYILGAEVLMQVPAAFRRGGIATTLGQALKEGEWRGNASESMAKAINASKEEWAWIISSFKMDLLAMENRTRFLTALAGAVFFLLMQGIDSIADGDAKATWAQTSFMGMVESSAGDLSQYVGLTLFLVLLYLSGNQTFQTLRRYLNCAELILRKKDPDR
jgi:hypothetical protein